LDCGLYIHPPQPRCNTCGGTKVEPSPVSGSGKVASFSINYQQWAPGVETPFAFAAVELDEQAELYVFTNIVNCTMADVTIGLPVEVLFEVQDDVYLPMFQPKGAAS